MTQSDESNLDEQQMQQVIVQSVDNLLKALEACRDAIKSLEHRVRALELHAHQNDDVEAQILRAARPRQ